MFEQLKAKIALGAYGNSDSRPQIARGVTAPCVPIIPWMGTPEQDTAGSGICFVRSSPDLRASLTVFGTGFEYITEPAQAAEVLVSLQGKLCGFDIETGKHPVFRDHEQAGLDPHLSKPRLVQLYSGTGNVYVIDLFKAGTACLEHLPRIGLVAHNAVFELQHMLHGGLSLPGIHCTMLMANALTNDRPSLADTTKHYLDNLIVPKEEQKSDWSSPDLTTAQIEYAALDAVLPFKLHEILQAKIKDDGRERLYALLQGAQLPVAQMIHRGLGIDIAACKAVSEQVDKRMLEVGDLVLQRLKGVDKLTSSDQIAAWLEKNLPPSKIKAWPKTKTAGRLSTGKDDLERLRSHPGIAALLEYKKLVSIKSGFLKQMQTHVIPATGRLHPNFKIAGASTGRMSCSKPSVQNIPRGTLREMFIAEPGKNLICADYSQMETRIAALISGDQEMLGCYDRGDDLHILTAMVITGKQADQVSKEERNAAKAANFGLLFGQGATGLQTYARNTYRVNLSKEAAADIRKKFFRKYPVFRQWQIQIAGSVERCCFVETVSGRCRYLPEDSYYCESMNTPIQGAAAEIFYASLARLPKYLGGLDAGLVNVVHDEMVLEASEKDAPAAQAALERAMTEGFLEIFPEASTRDLVEAKIGKSWAEAK